MATSHVSTTYDRASEPHSGSVAESLFVYTAIAGAIAGAVACTALVGPSLGEIARVLAAPVGVVFGSLIGGMFGRLLALPACATSVRTPPRLIHRTSGIHTRPSNSARMLFCG